MRSVKQGDWKLITYDVMDGTARQTQRFNLAENPNELLSEHQAKNSFQTNLADDPRYAAKRKELEALLLAEERRGNDPSRLWDQPADGLTPPAASTPPAKQAKQAE